MRVAIGCILVAIATVGLAPSSQDLRARYGQPDVERFTVSPGVSLAVEYGSDHQACQMRIEPTQSLIHSMAPGDIVLPESDVSKILEEVASAGSRGKLIKTGSFQASCGLGNLAEHENVSIMRATTACSHSSSYADVGTMVIFKRDICRIPKDASGAVIWP